MTTSSTKSKAAEIYAKKQKEQQKFIEDKVLYALQEAYGTSGAYEILRGILDPKVSLDDLEMIIIGYKLEEEDAWYEEEEW